MDITVGNKTYTVDPRRLNRKDYRAFKKKYSFPFSEVDQQDDLDEEKVAEYYGYMLHRLIGRQSNVQDVELDDVQDATEVPFHITAFTSARLPKNLIAMAQAMAPMIAAHESQRKK